MVVAPATALAALIFPAFAATTMKEYRLFPDRPVKTWLFSEVETPPSCEVRLTSIPAFR